jgi:hypothetical protein
MGSPHGMADAVAVIPVATSMTAEMSAGEAGRTPSARHDWARNELGSAPTHEGVVFGARKHVVARALVGMYHWFNECMEMHMNETESRVNDNAADRAEAAWNDDCECLHPAAVMNARRLLGDSPPVEDLAAVFG